MRQLQVIKLSAVLSKYLPRCYSIHNITHTVYIYNIDQVGPTTSGWEL